MIGPKIVLAVGIAANIIAGAELLWAAENNVIAVKLCHLMPEQAAGQMKDQYGFSRADMTNEGWSNYQRGLAEVAGQRGSNTSPYYGVSRVHCTNGYVDVRGHGGSVVNGSSVNMTVDEYRIVAKKTWDIYDYNYK